MAVDGGGAMKFIRYLVAVVMIAFLPISSSAQDKGPEFFQTVIKNAKGCKTGMSGSEVVYCYVKASPKKCESQVYEFFARSGDDKSQARRAWYFCVASCLNASFLSRSFGDCAREIK